MKKSLIEQIYSEATFVTGEKVYVRVPYYNEENRLFITKEGVIEKVRPSFEIPYHNPDVEPKLIYRYGVRLTETQQLRFFSEEVIHYNELTVDTVCCQLNKKRVDERIHQNNVRIAELNTSNVKLGHYKGIDVL